MPPLIDRYLVLSSLSGHMVDAARSGDWERLDTLEREVAAMREHIAVGGPGAGAQGGGQAQVGGLICKILDDDAEVRRHTEPWSHQLGLLLAGHLNGWRIPAAPQQGDDDTGGR